LSHCLSCLYHAVNLVLVSVLGSESLGA
jgi:hypothetical protein